MYIYLFYRMVNKYIFIKKINQVQTKKSLTIYGDYP